MAIDTFTKWIEAELVVRITAAVAKKLFMRNIVTRFGVPSRLITNNGIQFISDVFQDYCDEIGTKICFASVAHLHSNGTIERANGQIMQGIKKRVFNRLKAC